jgi:hypothetical protein
LLLLLVVVTAVVVMVFNVLSVLILGVFLILSCGKEIELDLEIAWPSGIYVDRVEDPNSGAIYRFGRLRQSTVAVRPHWENIGVVEDVLTVKETQDLIRAAENYALLNGWSKGRHVDYSIRPTKDHSVDTILNQTELASLKATLAEKLFPKFKRQYGLRPSLLRIEDLFITKYESTSKENALAPHIDKNPWSFVIALNDEFRGGGTYFLRHQRVWNVPQGAAVVFHGYQMHGAYRIESGTRYILAGFCEYGNNTDEFFMTQYDPKYEGNAAAEGFHTGDLIIGLERCEFETIRPEPLEEGQCAAKAGVTETLVTRTLVPITTTTTDEEWAALAHSCEQLSPSSKAKMRVRRYVPDDMSSAHTTTIDTVTEAQQHQEL